VYLYTFVWVGYYTLWVGFPKFRGVTSYFPQRKWGRILCPKALKPIPLQRSCHKTTIGLKIGFVNTS